MKITNLSTPIVNNINRAHSALPPIDSRIQLFVGAIFLFIFALFLYNRNSSSTNAIRQVSVKDPKSKSNNDESSIGSTSNSSSFHPKSEPVSKKKSEPKTDVPKKQSQQGPGKVTKDQTSSQKSFQAQDSIHKSSKSSVESSSSNDSNSSFNLKNIDYFENRFKNFNIPSLGLDTLLHQMDLISKLSKDPDPNKTINFKGFKRLSTNPMKKSPIEIQEKLQDLLTKLSKDPNKLTTGHLINILKDSKYKDYVDSMKEMNAQYHPYNSSVQEFKSKFEDHLGTDKAVRMALYLLGFYTVDPTAPTIKGCPNRTTPFFKAPVDLIPTCNFITLFGNDSPIGMMTTERNRLSHTWFSQLPKDDFDWYLDNITTEEHREKFLKQSQNSDYDDLFDQ